MDTVLLSTHASGPQSSKLSLGWDSERWQSFPSFLCSCGMWTACQIHVFMNDWQVCAKPSPPDASSRILKACDYSAYNLPQRLASPSQGAVHNKHKHTSGGLIVGAAPSECAQPTWPQLFLYVCMCLCIWPLSIPSLSPVRLHDYNLEL